MRARVARSRALGGEGAGREGSQLYVYINGLLQYIVYMHISIYIYIYGLLQYIKGLLQYIVRIYVSGLLHTG